jgi:hypothetical protein
MNSKIWQFMGWGNGRILRGVGGSFQVIPNLRWKMALMLDSGMICSIEIWPLGQPFQIYMASFVQR